MLDAFHALSVVVSKDAKASPGEAEILRYTTEERKEVSRRISHMLSGKLTPPKRCAASIVNVPSPICISEHGISAE